MVRVALIEFVGVPSTEVDRSAVARQQRQLAAAKVLRVASIHNGTEDCGFVTVHSPGYADRQRAESTTTQGPT